MKVLYAIQGTGNGHVCRAREVIPHLNKMADVDIFLSGNQSHVNLPFQIKYKSKGLCLKYNNHGSLNYLNTLKSLQFNRIRKEINELPVQNYDLVISDFECISVYAARAKGIPTMAFSHQAALLSKFSPKPRGLNLMGEFILANYAPSKHAVGLHFKAYDDYIFTPIIRQEVRLLNPINLGHYTVYLPAYGDRELVRILSQLPEVRWEVFSRETRTIYMERNITIRPIQNDTFLKSLETCQGILTGAGFETPAEALFLGKNLFVIPIGGQYEQLCNATALEQLGVPYSRNLDFSMIEKLRTWINESFSLQIPYPNITEQLIENMLFDQSMFFLPTLVAG